MAAAAGWGIMQTGHDEAQEQCLRVRGRLDEAQGGSTVMCEDVREVQQDFGRVQACVRVQGSMRMQGAA